METRAAYAAVGAFVLALIAGLVIAALWLAHGQFSRQLTRYDIFFASVTTGLGEGSPVRISGVQVGRVDSVVLDPENPARVRVRIEVSARAPIKSDSVASIELTGLTGGAAVEITPGSRTAPPIAISEGRHYPVIWSRESSLQLVVANVPQLLAKVTELADRMTDVVDEQNRAALASTLANLNRVTAAAASHSDDLAQLLANGAQDTQELHRTILSLQDTMQAMQQTLRHFNGVADQASETVRDMDSLVKENRAPLRDFTTNGLDELRQLVAQTQTLVGALTRTVNQLDRDPSRLLYGDRRTGYKPQ